MSTALSYGSDQSGLVCGYLFGRTPECKGVPLDTDAACAWLKVREQHPQEFILRHHNLPNTPTEKWPPRHPARQREMAARAHRAAGGILRIAA